MQLIKIANVQPNHEFIFVFTHTLKNEGVTDHFFIPILPNDGHIELETIINEVTKNGINFDCYRIDPFEGEDNPS